MSWTCRHCSETIEDQFDSCWKCGANSDGFPESDFSPETAPLPEFSKSVQAVVLTTAPSLEGYQIIETLDIVSSECVYGMNLFRDMFVWARDIVGGRSESSQKVLRDARKICLMELRREAESLGANAVIAVALDYSEISGNGKSMLLLVASGTAVLVSPKAAG